jgi:hypothetical protein
LVFADTTHESGDVQAGESKGVIDMIKRITIFRSRRCPSPAAMALFLLVIGFCQSCAVQSAAQIEARRAAIQSEMQSAIGEVQRIVNQPVRQLAPTGDMEVATYRPGWFHDGANKPDFNNVDVRKSQDTSYGRHQYVTSDLNPGIVFVGPELEFNPMTKYFYMDRTLPKKKLSEDEMIEINRLYRIIGRCEQQLAELQK